MSDNDKSASQVQREIGERVFGNAHAYWNGCGQAIIDEMVVLGQREGVDAVIVEIDAQIQTDDEIEFTEE